MHHTAAAADLQTADGRRPAVVIVGGSAAGALVASVLCEQFGCSTTTVPNGEAILALLRSDAVADLMVMDLAVPGMTGMVAMELIRAMGHRHHLPVVALTSGADQSPPALARLAGFAATVVKPYSPRELYRAMRTALRQPAASALVS